MSELIVCIIVYLGLLGIMLMLLKNMHIYFNLGVSCILYYIPRWKSAFSYILNLLRPFAEILWAFGNISFDKSKFIACFGTAMKTKGFIKYSTFFLYRIIFLLINWFLVLPHFVCVILSLTKDFCCYSCASLVVMPLYNESWETA